MGNCQIMDDNINNSAVVRVDKQEMFEMKLFWR